MKQINPVVLILILGILSCKKEGVVPVPPYPEPTYEYKYDGKLLQFHGGDSVSNEGLFVSADIYKEPISQREPAFYHFVGLGGIDSVLNISIHTDSLTTTTYNIEYSATQYEDQPGVDNGGFIFGLSKPEDHFTVTITSFVNGLVSGTFSGNLSLTFNKTELTPPDSAVITEGKFANVKVHY